MQCLVKISFDNGKFCYRIREKFCGSINLKTLYVTQPMTHLWKCGMEYFHGFLKTTKMAKLFFLETLVLHYLIIICAIRMGDIDTIIIKQE